MSGLKLILSDARGVYIPRDFALAYDAKRWNVCELDAKVLEAGPDDDGLYWEAWDEVLSTAELIDDKGNKWLLYQDGDLWAYCADLMTDCEKVSLFGHCD